MSAKPFVAAAFVLVLAGCVAPSSPSLTPLEIQAIQTRSYETPKNTVFASVVSVFQDLGYTIKSAHRDTGFISAESTTSGSNVGNWVILFGGAPSSSSQQTKATAFVEEIGSKTQVRLNFVYSYKSSSYGTNYENERAVLEQQPYRVAFEKIENAIFVRSAQ